MESRIEQRFLKLHLPFRFGLAGKTDIDAAEADQAVDALNDLMINVLPIRRENDEEKKAELKKKVQIETMPSWLKMMEALLTSKGGNHFAGNQLTWADIAIYHSFDLLKVRIFRQTMCLHNSVGDAW